MTTPLQQAIFEELDKYTSIEIMRENAQTIADNVAKRDDIESCSKTYVMRIIKRKEDSSAKVQFKVEPAKSEPEESDEDEEDGPDESTYALDPYDEPEDSDNWEFDAPEEPKDEEESESTEKTPKPEEMPLDQILSKENVEMLISVPFRMAADFTGWDGAELTASEKKRITPMARAIMLKYVPDLMAQYFVEIVFILVVGEIVVAKYRAYSTFASEQESKKKAQEQATKQAEIAEKRKMELEEEEAARKAAESPTPPEIEDSGRPLTKEEAGNPSWNQPSGLGGGS